jgi:hypothetical protein
MRYLKCPYCAGFRPAYEKECLNENCTKQAMKHEGFFPKNWRWPKKRDLRRFRFSKEIKPFTRFPELSYEGD